MIDLDTGILSEAKDYKNHIYQSHPDTGAKIEGVRVDQWDKVLELCVGVASHFNYIPFLSWDVVVSERGLSVIEINTSTGLTFLQMWGGLRHSELGDFFRYHKVIR